MPIAYMFGNDSKAQQRWQSNFLSAGLAYGWARGRTKFFKYDQYQPKNSYFGVGFMLAVSATSMNDKDFDTSNANVGPKLTKISSSGTYTAPLIQVGMHVGESFGYLQLIQAAGFGWAVGYPAQNWNYQGKFFVGFGIGLSIFNLAIPGGVGGVGGGH